MEARILEWAAISFSRGSSWPRAWTWVSCIIGRFFTIWAMREVYFLDCLKNEFSTWFVLIGIQTRFILHLVNDTEVWCFWQLRHLPLACVFWIIAANHMFIWHRFCKTIIIREMMEVDIKLWLWALPSKMGCYRMVNAGSCSWNDRIFSS